MKILDITPKPPIERTFSIELTENELKNITFIIGQCTPDVLKRKIENNDWSVQALDGMTYISPNEFYDNFKNVINNK